MILTALCRAFTHTHTCDNKTGCHKHVPPLTGDVIIQIAESQRRLTNELDGMFRWFHGEVLRDMENNVKLDKDFITGSRRRYEMEVRNQVAAQERQQRRGGPWDGGEQAFFLQQSQRDALMEEERRYRFLAEKHCQLSQNIAQLMNKTGGGLQRRAEEWTERVGATRAARPRTPSREQVPGEDRWQEEVPLGRVPSRGPSPQPTRSRSSSVGDGLAAGRLMRAKVNHAPSGNPTILDFNRDDIIVVLIQQPRNGWLYGRGEHGNRQGWFPAAYVEPLDQAPPPPPAPAFTSQSMRSSHSMSNHHDQSGGG
ncbi:brain-specific angiogenesis inhibitor 1-associated protein 2-like protein 2, partial [Engraulis encrasicolus]|uniref:brain-specific angiogenesis inhibitor 1-associated protein 2-like protein 2 n=1 Tax=Engraulis encrasicolus TaxID=184585 RepID=UPI002FD42B09